MKFVILAVLTICATSAFGQGYISSQAQPLIIYDHPQHARNHVMAADQNLRGDESPYTYAQGEIPLKDVAMVSSQISLGDVAREYRKQHASQKKARIVWDN